MNADGEVCVGSHLVCVPGLGGDGSWHAGELRPYKIQAGGNDNWVVLVKCVACEGLRFCVNYGFVPSRLSGLP